MAFLNYKILPYDQSWVIHCESVPVDIFHAIGW